MCEPVSAPGRVSAPLSGVVWPVLGAVGAGAGVLVLAQWAGWVAVLLAAGASVATVVIVLAGLVSVTRRPGRGQRGRAPLERVQVTAWVEESTQGWVWPSQAVSSPRELPPPSVAALEPDRVWPAGEWQR